MFSTKEMPSASSLFSAYASMAASIMLFRSMANDLIPYPFRGYLYSALGCLLKRSSNTLTLAIEQHNGITTNEVFEAAEVYLTTKINPNTERLRVSKSPKEKNLNIRLEKGEKVIDYYEGIQLKWRFVCVESERKDKHSFDQQPAKGEKRFFDLSFDKKHKDMVLNSYLPFVIDRAKIMKDSQRVLKMHTLGKFSYSHGLKWEAINLEHPSTFETLAMDPEIKNSIIDDLNRFVRRKEFYKKVGRAWKRGYLLYGPPGTGKSSLIAAMANYLKFDIFDLQLTNVTCDSDLRKLLLATANKSILVIEDIDCGVDLPDRQRQPHRNDDGSKRKDVQLTLSGLLNFIDGLWSSCGDERIIIFTTNHKEKLDPALLRPGRMDMHIHMSYCTYSGFKTLAFNYLGISGHAHHQFFGEIEALLKDTQVTPAQVAEEMMKGEDADASLQGLVKLLKRKKMEEDDEDETAKVKRQKIVKPKRKSVRINRTKSIGRRRNL